MHLTLGQLPHGQVVPPSATKDRIDRRSFGGESWEVPLVPLQRSDRQTWLLVFLPHLLGRKLVLVQLVVYLERYGHSP